MVPYQMNMARGHVLPLATRKRWRRGLAVYLLLVVAVLGGSVALLTLHGIELSNLEESLRLRERELLNQRPGFANAGEYMRKLGREMAVCESQLNALNGFRAGECRAGGIILGLVNVMPAGMDLGQVSLDGAAAKLGCEVYVPIGLKNGDLMTPPYLISLWSSEPLLTGRVSRFTSEKSERALVDEREVMKWRFTGVMGGGK